MLANPITPKFGTNGKTENEVLLAPSKDMLDLVWQCSVVGNVDPASTACSSTAKGFLIVFHSPRPSYCHEEFSKYREWLNIMKMPVPFIS